MQYDMSTWTTEEIQMAHTMGSADLNQQVRDVPSYNRYDTIASTYSNEPFTPAQMVAWANFAKTLGDGIVISGQAIQRLKTRDDLARDIVARAVRQVERAEKERLAARQAEIAEQERQS